jgi:hypothetical protein
MPTVISKFLPLEKSMKPKLLIFIFLCFLTSCVFVPPQWSGRDRFGIMKIDIPGDYNDYTRSYLQDVEKVRVSRGRPQDPGIKSLLMIKRSDGNAYCKFRELRYLQNEVVYDWGMDRLATEVALAFNKIFSTHGMMDYYNLGLVAPIGQQTANRTKLVSSSAVTVNTYSGWQTTYNHWVHPQMGLTKSISQNKTVVIRKPVEGTLGAPRFYIVAECAAGGIEGNVNSAMQKITEMLNTIQLGSDIAMDGPRQAAEAKRY